MPCVFSYEKISKHGPFHHLAGRASSKFNDFEDGLPYYTAREQNLFGIITRNIKDYKTKDMVIQTSKEFVKINAELFEDEKNS
jgi:hypothetical protein